MFRRTQSGRSKVGVQRGCGAERSTDRRVTSARLGSLALVLGLVVLAGPQVASAQSAQAPAPSPPEVSFVAQPSTAPCAVFPAGVVRNVGSTADAFTVTVRVAVVTLPQPSTAVQVRMT